MKAAVLVYALLLVPLGVRNAVRQVPAAVYPNLDAAEMQQLRCCVRLRKLGTLCVDWALHALHVCRGRGIEHANLDQVLPVMHEAQHYPLHTSHLCASYNLHNDMLLVLVTLACLAMHVPGIHEGISSGCSQANCRVACMVLLQ
jgi:hypothetical protein